MRRERVYRNLGAALTAMDMDADGARSFVERMGPRAASFSTDIPTEDGTDSFDATVDFYPNQAVVSVADEQYVPDTYDASALVPYDAAQACAPGDGTCTASAQDITSYYQAAATPLPQDQPSSTSANAVSQATPSAAPGTVSAQDSFTIPLVPITTATSSLVDDSGGSSMPTSLPSLNTQAMMDQFNSLSPAAKVGVVVGGGYVLTKMIPLQYLILGGALYLWAMSQQQKAAAPASSAATTTPVAGLG